MTTLITQVSRTATATHVEATCNKTSAVVSIYAHGVQVVCLNASHRAWRGGGRHFPTIASAMDNYRSGEMKAIIGAAALCHNEEAA